MSKKHLHRPFSKLVGLTALMVLMCVYFSFHLLQGERSYFTLKQLEGHSASLSDDLGVLEAQRAALEMRVRKMRPDAVDPDLLEEQAMFMFGPRRDNLVQIIDPSASMSPDMSSGMSSDSAL